MVETIAPNLFNMVRYYDEEILELLRDQPSLTFIEYETKKRILDGMSRGWYKMQLVGDKVFLLHEHTDGTMALVLFQYQNSTRTMKNLMVADYRRFCSLLIKARCTSK
ncbi:hypothetical protein [uncultured Duncaniella sp.]|uniref:hypothetical protein n=1 Tax=uncultured Duncaniella sp. TaxID=2768039 RepID=UPI00260C8D4F|nr:hypothetical protein [uncultured Duncaniella sp.]